MAGVELYNGAGRVVTQWLNCLSGGNSLRVAPTTHKVQDTVVRSVSGLFGRDGVEKEGRWRYDKDANDQVKNNG